MSVQLIAPGIRRLTELEKMLAEFGNHFKLLESELLQVSSMSSLGTPLVWRAGKGRKLKTKNKGSVKEMEQ